MICAFGANLMMTSYGLAAASSGFLIPQLEDPAIGFGITIEEGSWLCKYHSFTVVATSVATRPFL